MNELRISMLDHPPDGLCVEMVLPVRIELTTSALPRMRSTTELRQHRHLSEDGRGYGQPGEASQGGLRQAPERA